MLSISKGSTSDAASTAPASNLSQWPDVLKAGQDLAKALSAGGATYALGGSAAAILHGAVATQKPGDLDVAVAAPMAAKAAMEKSADFTVDPAGTLAVLKFTHTNGTEIDILHGDDFGMSPAAMTVLEGISTFNLEETMLSLVLRPKIRQKDVVAFCSLVLSKGDTLSEPAKKKIVGAAQKRNPKTKTWDDLVADATAAKTALRF